MEGPEPPAAKRPRVYACCAPVESPVDALRTRSVVLLAEAMEDSTPLFDRGVDVESAVAATHGPVGSAAYTGAVRRLVASLRRNELLRADVREGRLSASAFVAAPAETLTTQTQRTALRASEQAALRRSLRDEEEGLPTTAFACPACTKREAFFLRVGGTRDIGKSETWGSKDAETAQLRLKCAPCKVRTGPVHKAPRGNADADADVRICVATARVGGGSGLSREQR